MLRLYGWNIPSQCYCDRAHDVRRADRWTANSDATKYASRCVTLRHVGWTSSWYRDWVRCTWGCRAKEFGEVEQQEQASAEWKPERDELQR